MTGGSGSPAQQGDRVCEHWDASLDRGVEKEGYDGRAYLQLPRMLHGRRGFVVHIKRLKLEEERKKVSE